jgi:hypothetical protein
MKFTKIEYHQVHSHFNYDIPEEDIIDTFGSVERFKEIASHLSSNDWNEPEGEYPTDEETDEFYEFLDGLDYDREDDWFSDRKGGYDIAYEVGDDE